MHGVVSGETLRRRGLGAIVVAGLTVLLIASLGATSFAGARWAPTQTHAVRLAKAQRLGDLGGTTPMRIAVGLRLHRQRQLGVFIRSVQTSGSANYGRFLTPSQFRDRYAPTSSDAAAVVRYLRHEGFGNIAVEPNRMYVTANGTAAATERAFDTQLVRYRQRGANVYANSRPARVPTELAGIVGAVLGLNSTARMHVPTRSHPVDTVGTIKGYYAPEFWKAYHAGSVPAAHRTPIAIFASGDVRGVVTDLRAYEADQQNHLPAVPVTVVKVGTPSSDTAAAGEWDLDTQTSTGMAGSVSHLYLYDTTSLTDIDVGLMFNRFVTQNVARAGSASFGECEYQAYLDGFMLINDQAMAEAAAQGQTVFASSGDTGGFCPVVPDNGVPAGAPDVNYPASSPYVASVGGTTLLTNADGSYNNEAAWVAGGGGPSYFEYEPEWQRDATPPTAAACVNYAACLGRNVPDIAMDSDPNTGAIVYVGGSTEQIGGTSLGSPLALGVWARFQSFWNNRLGFASPRLYAHAGSAGYHDITLGDVGPYPATPGWDYATGLGTFDIGKMTPLIGKAITKPTLPPVKLAAPACALINDAGLDAPSFETGDQVDSMDIRAAGLNSDSSSVTATIAVTSLDSGPAGQPTIAGDGDNWYFSWKSGETTYWLGAAYPGNTPDPKNPTLLVDYNYGTVDTTPTGGSLYNTVGSATGSIDLKKGVIKITTDLANVGSPAAGATLSGTSSQTLESVGTPFGGLLESVDSAGPGKAYPVGKHC